MGLHTVVAALAVALTVHASQGQTTSGQSAYEPGNGTSNPVLIKKVDPQSTPQAKAQNLTGEVWLDAVVKVDGTVEVVKVQKSPNGGAAAGLDEAAIDAAKQWLFKPGVRDGKSVPVHVVLIMEFKGSSQSGEGQQVYAPGQPIRNPLLKSKVDPHYSREAMQAKIQGEVQLDAIIETDGSVNVLGIKKSLDKTFGLDDAAIEAAKQWRFDPGTLNGKPVRVRVTLVMEFKLH